MLQETSVSGTPPGKRRETEAWYREMWLQLYRFAYARVQNREEAEDLAQETCARVLGSPSTATAGPPTREFLFTTALNLIRDRWRRSRVRGITVTLDEAILLHASEHDEAVQRAWIQELLAKLPPDYREVFELRIVRGYSRAETATRMGKSEAAVRNLQYRAVQTMRDLMRDHLKEEK